MVRLFRLKHQRGAYWAIVVPVIESRQFSLEGHPMTTDDTLKKARDRAKQMGLPYEGALTPQEAFEILQESRLRGSSTCARALSWIGSAACPARSRSSC